MYEKVYQLAEAKTGKSLPAKCCLAFNWKAEKITRNLTTATVCEAHNEPAGALSGTSDQQECHAR
ncbi:hypothetical protein ACNKHW_01630 [Shigella flexneri]